MLERQSFFSFLEILRSYGAPPRRPRREGSDRTRRNGSDRLDASLCAFRCLVNQTSKKNTSCKNTSCRLECLTEGELEGVNTQFGELGAGDSVGCKGGWSLWAITKEQLKNSSNKIEQQVHNQTTSLPVQERTCHNILTMKLGLFVLVPLLVRPPATQTAVAA